MRAVARASALTAALIGISWFTPVHDRYGWAAEPCTKAAAERATEDDRRTSEEIRRRLIADDTMSPAARRISVETHEGVVTLRGAVESSEERMVVASLAESAPGVRHVDDRLWVGR